MKKTIGIASLFFLSTQTFALTCPSPKDGLAEGKIPAPWLINPFLIPPQADSSTQFSRAVILNSGQRGIACFYRQALGEVGIWRPTLVKLPLFNRNWVSSLGGFVCSASRESCKMHTIQ